MATTPANLLVRSLNNLIEQGASEHSDRALIERFIVQRDEIAFTALVQRYAPMVWRLCRRLLENWHDAEDAFQATFLLLSRKAGSIRRTEAVSSWLYGTAHRVALQAREAAKRRRAHENRASLRPATDPLTEISMKEAISILDDEIMRLPETQRAPVLLCCLEGASREEAARQLGIAPSLVKSRLEEGRERLSRRLALRGMSLSTTLSAVLLAQSGSAAVSLNRMVHATLDAVCSTLTSSIQKVPISAAVNALVAGPRQTLWRALMNHTAIVVAGLGVVAAGGVLAHLAVNSKPAEAQAPIASRTDKAPEASPKIADGESEPTDRSDAPLPHKAVVRLGTMRFNHGNGLSALRYSPLGTTIVSVGGGFMRFWDAQTGKEVGATEVPIGWGYHDRSIQFAGTTVGGLTEESDGPCVRFWDLRTGKEVRNIKLPVKRNEWSVMRQDSLSADGRLALVHSKSSVQLFDIETAKELCRLPKNGDLVRAAVFAGEHNVVTAGTDRQIEVRQAKTGNLIRGFNHEAPVESIYADAKGTRLATLEHHTYANDRFLDKDVIHVWDLAQGKELHRLYALPKSWFMNVQFTPDGKRLLGWSVREGDTYLTVWDVETGKRVHESRNVAAATTGFSPDGRLVACGALPGKFSLYDLQTGRSLADAASDHANCYAVSLSAKGDLVTTLGVSSISAWDSSTGRRLHSFPITTFRFAPWPRLSDDGRTAVTFARGDDGKTHRLVWDVASGKKTYELIESEGAVAVAPDSSVLALGQRGDEAKIRLFDLGSGKFTGELASTFPAPMSQLCFTAEGRILFVVGQSVAAYDVPSRKNLFSWRFPKELINSGGPLMAPPARRRADDVRWRSVAISPDGRLLACVLDGGFASKPAENRIALLDARSGRVIRHWNDSGRPSNNFEQMAFSRDSRLLASSDGKVIHLWEVATGNELCTFEGHRGEIRHLCFSADGRRLASAANDSTVVIWDLVPVRQGAVKGVADYWADLAAADAEKAYSAIWRLAESPQGAVPYIREHLKPIPAPDQKRIGKLIEELDCDVFASRDKATAELAKLREAAAPALRAALSGKPTAEAQQRMDKLLEKLANQVDTPQEVRDLRAVQALEYMGTPEARQVLSKVAQGAAGCRLTEEAQASLKRLIKRDAPQPTGSSKN